MMFFGKILPLSSLMLPLVAVRHSNSSGNCCNCKLYRRSLNCNFLYTGAVAAFDNGVKLIVMYRWIVSVKYGIETGKF